MRYKKRKKHAKQTMGMAILVVAALAVLTVLTVSQVFVVRDVMVVGNRNLLREEVVTQSGVEIGDNMLSVTSGLLRDRLEQNRYIEYLGHGFDYRGRLTVRINERMGMAVVYELGYYYVLDEAGMVLECVGSGYPLDVAGPKVNGFELEQNSRITVGEVLPVGRGGQLEAMKIVIEALDETNMLARTSLLDVTNTFNMYAMTAEGAMIVLGNERDMRTKLLIAKEVLSIREAAGDLKGARIDVSSGKNAHYIPAVLPTVTPVPTATPTIEPKTTPKR